MASSLEKIMRSLTQSFSFLDLFTFSTRNVLSNGGLTWWRPSTLPYWVYTYWRVEFFTLKCSFILDMPHSRSILHCWKVWCMVLIYQIFANKLYLLEKYIWNWCQFCRSIMKMAGRIFFENKLFIAVNILFSNGFWFSLSANTNSSV